MKNSLTLLAAMLCSMAYAQVEIDKPILLTGSGADARVGGISEVSSPGDAVSAAHLQQGSLIYSPAAGSDNAIVLTIAPIPPAYAPGMVIHFLTSASNTGAVTLNLNGLGVKQIRKAVSAQLDAGDFQPGQMVSVIYDGTHFQWLNPTGGSGGGGGGVPAGACFTSTNPVSPAGYSRGSQIAVHTSGWSSHTAPPQLSGWGSFGRSLTVWDNRIYVFGGDTYGENDKAFEYDPSTNTWTEKASFPGRGRGNTAAVTVGDKMYLLGGQHPSFNTVAWVDEYDPISNTWSTKADMPTNRRYLSAAVADGKIYAFGGGNYSAVDVVEEYDPATNSWTSKTPMPSAREYMTAIPYGGLIYVLGGSDGWGPVGEALTYNPATDSWNTLQPPPPSPNLSFSGAVLGDFFYLASGTSLWEYNPANDTYLARNGPPQNVSYFIPGAAVNDRVYLMDSYYTISFHPETDRTLYTHCPD